MEVQSIEQLNWAYGLLVMSPEPLWKMWRIASMLVGLALHESLIENEREFYFVNNPIGSMVLVYILTLGVYWWDPCYHIWQHHGSYGNVQSVQYTLLCRLWNLMTLSSFVPQNCSFAGAILGPKNGMVIFRLMIWWSFSKYVLHFSEIPRWTPYDYKTLQDITKHRLSMPKL